MIDTLTVQVTETMTAEYRADIAGFGSHLAQGGVILSLESARGQAKAFFRANHSPIIKAVKFWVALDDSGLAYHVSINRRGSHTIDAASPLPGPGNVQEVYKA